MLEKTMGIKEIEPGVYRISGLMVYRFLVVGEEKALLMDTGYGLVDLEKVIRKITDKPLLVVNSHFHPDHSGGNYRFPKVYVNEHDLPFAGEEREIQKLTGRVSGAIYEKYPILKKVAGPIVDLMLVTKEGDTKYVPIKDGYVFDLGGRKLKTRWLPGHTEGSMAFLDEENHFILAGDATAANTSFWMWTNPSFKLSDYGDVLNSFYKEIKGKGYRHIYGSHSPFPNSTGFVKSMATYCKKLPSKKPFISIPFPGYPDDRFCIRAGFGKHGPMFLMYFESQAK